MCGADKETVPRHVLLCYICFADVELFLLQMLAAKFSGNILINLLGVWAVSRFCCTVLANAEFY